MLHVDLLKTASDLLSVGRGRPKQAHLRRAMSSAYYALFHCLATNCANSFIGKGPDYERSAWQHVYRALEHNTAKKACKAAYIKEFPPDFQNYADLFVNMQEKRHNADYNPYFKFSKEDVEIQIRECKRSDNKITESASEPLESIFCPYFTWPAKIIKKLSIYIFWFF